MSVSRVQPPHVHQHIDWFATLAGSEAQEPSTERGILGIFTPLACTSAIHCCTWVELIEGTLSSAGYPMVGLKVPIALMWAVNAWKHAREHT